MNATAGFNIRLEEVELLNLYRRLDPTYQRAVISSLRLRANPEPPRRSPVQPTKQCNNKTKRPG
jgi:hypothetical protein